MYVIGTSGHVDHGKSTLIKALTGIDPDRLREEKERGLTIVLGFAWLLLPSGREISIIDVPGHERFIKNMLAGIGGIDLALLVIAADESVMPQTREHLAILDLLHVVSGIVVITKKDLVDEEWLELVVSDIEELLEGTSMSGSPIIAVSSKTLSGLEDLKQTIDITLSKTTPKQDLGRPRLSVDRTFTMAGFGTVVTGTLTDSIIYKGQELELVLSGKRSRVRGLQSHRRKIDQAVPGSRVAINLQNIAAQDIERGEVLTTPGWLTSTTAVDVHLRLIKKAPLHLRHNFPVTFHVGATETPARVRLLDQDELAPGQSGWAQLRLQDPVAVVKGDYFVIRASDHTLGGGKIVDAHPKRHRRRHIPTLEHLQIMEHGSTSDVLLKALETTEPTDLRKLANRANLSLPESREIAIQLIQQGHIVVLGNGNLKQTDPLYTAAGWAVITNNAISSIDAHHKQHPLRKGIQKEEMRNRLGMSPQVFSLSLNQMSNDGLIIEDGPLLRRPYHQISISEDQGNSMSRYIRTLEAEPFAPSTDTNIDPDLLNLLIDQGKVVKVSPEVVFSTKSYENMVSMILRHIKDNGNITVAEVRDMFKTSRKYALPLLEYLDHQHITRRIGDGRVLR